MPYKQDKRNANRGTDRGRDELRQSLKRLGAGRSVLVDKNGVAIAGNKTLEAATELGLTKTLEVETDGNTLVVVKRIDLDLETDIKAREMAFADNKIGQDNQNWDPEILKTDLALLDSDFLNGLWKEDDLSVLSVIGDDIEKSGTLSPQWGKIGDTNTIKCLIGETEFRVSESSYMAFMESVERFMPELSQKNSAQKVFEDAFRDN
jgi:hypothetical protein